MKIPPIPSFLAALEEAVQTLPGEEAQYLMAPHLRRQRALSNWPADDAHQSAVLILLFPQDNQLSTVLMRRQEYPGAHSGQISFPGGKLEESDSNLQHTAIRESEEEIGISPQKVRVLGKLSELYVPASHFNIHPYMAWSGEMPDFVPDPTEVAEIITVNLDELFHDSVKLEKDMPLRNGLQIRAPYYDVQGHVVWGATAMIISELEVLFSRLSHQ